MLQISLVIAGLLEMGNVANFQAAVIRFVPMHVFQPHLTRIVEICERKQAAIVCNQEWQFVSHGNGARSFEVSGVL